MVRTPPSEMPTCLGSSTDIPSQLVVENTLSKWETLSMLMSRLVGQDRTILTILGSNNSKTIGPAHSSSSSTFIFSSVSFIPDDDGPVKT